MHRLYNKVADMSGGSLARRMILWRWTPTLLACVIGACSVALWHAEYEQERQHAAAVLHAATETIKADIIDDMETRIVDLTQMAKLWGTVVPTGQKQLETSATQYSTRYPGVLGVAWIDSGYDVKWIVPPAEDLDLQSIYFRREAPRRAWQAAHDSRHTIVSSAIQHRSRHVLSACAPVSVDNSFRGCLVGVYRAEPLLDAVLADSASPDFKVAIFDGAQEPMYLLRGEPGEQPTALETTTVGMHGIDWKVQVWPERPIAVAGQSISTALLVAGFLLAAMVALVTHLARRASVAAATARESNDHLTIEIAARRRAEESLHVLSGRLLKVQDEERQTLAHILHEGMAQKLFALSMNLKVASRLGRSPELQSSMQQSIDLADECVCEMRAVTHLLHPPSLAVLGLLAACETYAQGFTERTGIEVTIEFSDDPARFPQDMEMALFRVVQESLDNIHRHSGSKTARLRLAHDDGLVVLEIQDRGRGLAPGSGETGIGIAGMRERMLQLGGELHLDSTKSGTTVRAILPYLPEREASTSNQARKDSMLFADWESGRNTPTGRVN